MLDPDAKAPPGTPTRHYWLASPDGSHVIVGTSPAGRKTPHPIIETATAPCCRNHRPGPVRRARRGLPDGSGFFFVRFRPGTSTAIRHYLDSFNWLHGL